MALTYRLLLSGDQQAGTDALLLEGDQQSGSDVLLLEGVYAEGVAVAQPVDVYGVVEVDVTVIFYVNGAVQAEAPDPSATVMPIAAATGAIQASIPTILLFLYSQLFAILLSGDEQIGGGDVILLTGDEQTGTDAELHNWIDVIGAGIASSPAVVVGAATAYIDTGSALGILLSGDESDDTSDRILLSGDARVRNDAELPSVGVELSPVIVTGDFNLGFVDLLITAAIQAPPVVSAALVNIKVVASGNPQTSAPQMSMALWLGILINAAIQAQAPELTESISVTIDVTGVAVAAPADVFSIVEQIRTIIGSVVASAAAVEGDVSVIVSVVTEVESGPARVVSADIQQEPGVIALTLYFED